MLVTALLASSAICRIYRPLNSTGAADLNKYLEILERGSALGIGVALKVSFFLSILISTSRVSYKKNGKLSE
ncbi:hypothetical protein RchiOBHm_Chr4g0407241 [Rosa chinensis]|uniref:Uncharacterized protein n=1 Tax=Rosa chinensis TaxID=74649 RepID=A0A2P6QUJ4_ROSCH|nr:hypothetical protein RchiOBHm_Chr4g0407241 [Rosa chinensis]